MKSSVIILFIFLLPSFSQADWGIDFSRRQKDMVDLEKQRMEYKEEKKSILDMVTDRQQPMQDLVIMNTAKGFLPQKIQIKRNQRYRIHVINTDKKNKNLSFMMDAFSEHHGTYFGEPKSFVIEARKEGLFDFQCPETGKKGQVVVYASDTPIDSPLESIRLRRPASE